MPQTNISVGAVSAAEVAEARRAEEEEGAASLDRAAQYVRVAGATDKSGERITGAREIAQRYAGAVTDAGDGGGQQGLLMSFATRGLSRGVEIHMFSLYPKEREFLYPPLTYLLFDETREIEDADGLTTVPVLPTMP